MTDLSTIRSLVQVELDSITKAGQHVTPELIRQTIRDYATFRKINVDAAGVPLEALARSIETDINVYVGTWNVLEGDAEGHSPWLEERREGIDWLFWSRYERYLRQDVKLPTSALERLDQVTDEVLQRLEDPTRPGTWDRRGLVAGQVQSGKTGNYTGLIAKSLDAGYKLVVVLAGVHNSLRSQTQYRIDEGILGFDTRNGLRSIQSTKHIGVGLMAGKFLHVSSFTSSENNGDFRSNVASNLGVAVGGSDPIVLVVKKNASILRNLYQWATALTKDIDADTGKKTVRDVPILVIDDEADHASVDTSAPKRGQDPSEVDPTTINLLIRQFLDTFAQSAYVAYTATPFANIFMDHLAVHDKAGKDLFPSAFIINLPAASNYVGPARVFGLSADEAAGIEETEALPILREVDDSEMWLPSKHKSDDSPGDGLPNSLRDAILTFVMGVAIRKVRGHQHKHHSMLVHVTRFKYTQREVMDRVLEEVEDLRDRAVLGEGGNPVLYQRAMAMFADDFVPTHKAMVAADLPDSLVGELPTFEEVWEQLPEVLEQTRVHLVNGDSRDALEYVDHPNGLTVIAIGGDKLSRGLTLEGLSVSYYLRASRMYDTLMQMGRWFGYRPDYLDTCRLYTTSELAGWYRAVTAAAEELQSEFEAMAVTKKTPLQFGLRVQQHPNGLMVSSPTKLRHAVGLKISYAGTMAETVTFLPEHIQDNWSALTGLVAQLGEAPNPRGGLRIWTDVGAARVTTFLDGYTADPKAFSTQPGFLKQYIESRNADGELVRWTVALADADSTNDDDNPFRPVTSDLQVRLTRRKLLSSADGRHTIRRAVSPHHERIVIREGSDAWGRALKLSQDAWSNSARKNKSSEPPTKPGGFAVRQVMSPEEGLLLLYPLTPETSSGESPDATPKVAFAIAFPATESDSKIDYKVNKVFWDQAFGVEEDESEDEE